jgi:hypothetical protein
VTTSANNGVPNPDEILVAVYQVPGVPPDWPGYRLDGGSRALFCLGFFHFFYKLR